LTTVGILQALLGGEADPGVIIAAYKEAATALQRFVDVLSSHRIYVRESSPAKG
jgi:hypothetical protein